MTNEELINEIPWDEEGEIRTEEKNTITVDVAKEPEPPATQENSFSLSNISNLNFDQMWRVANCFARSRMLPKGYDSPEKVLIGLQYSRELGFSETPLTAMKNISVINGAPSIWGELPLSMVLKSGRISVSDINEYIIDKDYKKICVENKNLGSQMFAAICEITYKGVKKQFSFTIGDATKANLIGKDVYRSYGQVMFKRRARSVALKDMFPDILTGIDIAEYSHNVLPKEDEGGARIVQNEATHLEDIILQKDSQSTSP